VRPCDGPTVQPPGGALLDDGGSGAREAVGVGAGLDDVAAEGQSVDDAGAEVRGGEGLGPPGECLVGGYGDAGVLFSLREHLEQQFGPALVQFQIPKFVEL
jgi:hypothetical protein